MNIHLAYRDRHSQPVVDAPKVLEDWVPLITAQVTKEALKWSDGPDYEKAALKRFSKNGYQNEDYRFIVQLAVWYAAHLISEAKDGIKNAIIAAAAKAANFYLAIDINNNLKSFDELPFIVKQRTENLLHELPEFMAKVGVKTINPNGEKGALMNNQNAQCPPGHVLAQMPNGQFQCVPVQAAPSAQYTTGYQGTPQQTFPQQHMHPGQGYPQQTYPQQGYYQQPIDPRAYTEMAYNRLNQQRASRAYQPAPQQVFPQIAPSSYQQPVGSSWANYSNTQSTATNTMGMGSNNNSTVGRPVEVAPERTSVEQPKIIKESDRSWYSAPQENKTTEKPSESGQGPLKPTKNGGYKCDYVFPTRVPDELGIKLDYDIPRVYDAEEYKAVWILNSQKQVTGFELRGIEMDYEKHNVRQYFPAQRYAEEQIDKEKTLKALAQVQKKAYIAEKLDEIEPEVEGNVTPTEEYKEYKLGEPIEIARVLIGENSRYDYAVRALCSGEIPNSLFDKLDQVVINYEHQYFQPFVTSGRFAEVLIGLKTATTYSDIRDILTELLDDVGVEFVWQYINEVTTKYINNVLRYRYGLTLQMQSFYIDFIDLEDMLYNKHGIGSSFTETAKPLIRSTLYPYTPKDDLYVKGMGDSGVEDELTFGILSDVTILPISGDAFNLPVPIPEDPTVEETVLADTAIVSDVSYRELYNAIAHRVDNADPRASRIAFGTNDGQFFFVHRTATKKAFVISKEP